MTEIVDELFARTMLGDYDDEAPWAAVQELRTIGTREVLDQAAKCCASSEPLKRARGADILAQLGRTAEHRENNYPEDCFLVASSLVETEKETQPLSSGIHALGHIADPRAVPMIAEHQNHSVAEIRFAVACALGSFPDNATAVDALIHLTRDADDDVRDWATFGIGTKSTKDSRSIREALIERLEDSFENVRQEAIAGLTRLKDECVLPTLLSVLDQPEVPVIIVDAALEVLGHPDKSEGWTPANCAVELRKKFGK